MKGGRALPPPDRADTTLPLARGDPPARPQRSRADHAARWRRSSSEVGFKGTLPQFFEHMRTDPKFKPKSARADRALLRDRQAGRRQRIGAFLDHAQEQARDPPGTSRSARSSRPAAPTSSGTPDGSRPGVFYFNAYDLPSRTTPGMTTLYLHEGAPGHHFQISLAQENEALPNFMRFGGNTALCRRLGALCRDARDELGCTRPTPISASAASTTRCCARCGWWSTPASTPRVGPATRRSSTCSTTAHGPHRRHRRGRALHRHPGQALAYKVGAADHPASCAPRRKASLATGSTSALPRAGADDRRAAADVLEQKIDRWIADQQGFTRAAAGLRLGDQQVGGDRPAAAATSAGTPRPVSSPWRSERVSTSWTLATS
jgi:hypothetical protein